MGYITLRAAILITLAGIILINLALLVGSYLMPSGEIRFSLLPAGDNHTDLYLYDVRHGLGYVLLADLLGQGLSAAWSPDKHYIVYSNFRQNVPRRSIYIIHIYTKHITQISDSAYDYTTPTWSPDGQYIAYSGWFSDENGWDIVLYNLKTGGSQVIYAAPTQDIYPTWSPDSQSITFITADISHDGTLVGTNHTQTLYIH